MNTNTNSNTAYTERKRIEWRAVSGAAKYSIEIELRGPDTVYHPYLQSETTRPVYENTFYEGRYRSRVTVYNRLGFAGDPSSWNYFSIVMPPQKNPLEEPYKELQNNYTALENEKARLQAQLAATESDKTKAENEKAKAESDKARLEDEKAALEKDKNALENDKNTLKDENNKLKTELDAAKNSLDTLEYHNARSNGFLSLATGAEFGFYDYKGAFLPALSFQFDYAPNLYFSAGLKLLAAYDFENILIPQASILLRAFTPEFWRMRAFAGLSVGLTLFTRLDGYKAFLPGPLTFKDGSMYLSLLAGGTAGIRVRVLDFFCLEPYIIYTYPYGLTYGISLVGEIGLKKTAKTMKKNEKD
ncbi:MAG: hypothetical protein LBM77_08495 [Spirochaetaceae bacterium]|jgi:hypothetical protein|nr:hypothetical protein [Spirochaetaceae bacterium]